MLFVNGILSNYKSYINQTLPSKPPQNHTTTQQLSNTTTATKYLFSVLMIKILQMFAGGVSPLIGPLKRTVLHTAAACTFLLTAPGVK